jgi:uncharacterized protein with ParB-like and HNH nuclease domain
MNDTEKQSSQSIKELCVNIEKNIIALPEFQRDFVWDIAKSYDLFDSLIRDIFIGSIIYGIPSFEVTVRELDHRPRKAKGKRRKSLKLTSYTKEQIYNMVNTQKFLLVLDGQQRITSIYRALKGIDSVWFITKTLEELTDEFGEINFNDLTLEQIMYEIAGYPDEDRLSIKFSDVYAIMNESYFEAEIKELFFNQSEFEKSYDEEEYENQFRNYLIVSRKIQDLFKAQKLIAYHLLNMSSEKFALFFERSNSKGVQLNFIDILAAKLYEGFNLRKEMEIFSERCEEKYKFQRETIVRALSCIVSNGRNVDKKYILTNLTYHDFRTYWDHVCNLYKKVLDFLYDNHFIISQSWMPYENMIIPLMIFLRCLPNKDFSQMNENQKSFIHYWYWSSIFSQRYGGASNDIIIQDSNVLMKIANNEKIFDKVYFSKLQKIQISNYEDVFSFSKKSSSIYKGILNLINQNTSGLIDWSSTNRITFNSKLEDHHIFPVKYIENKYKNSPEIIELTDCVANRTLIPKISNIKIGKKAPSVYLKELKKNNPNLPKSLECHLIPEDISNGLYDEFFTDFITDRAKLIFDVIQDTITNKKDTVIKDFYDTIKIKGSSIKVFGKYRKKTVEATFNLNTEQILFNGDKYSSISTAANIAKENLGGKSNASTNGWKFWRFINDDGKEVFIDELRKKQSML